MASKNELRRQTRSSEFFNLHPPPRNPIPWKNRPPPHPVVLLSLPEVLERDAIAGSQHVACRASLPRLWAIDSSVCGGKEKMVPTHLLMLQLSGEKEMATEGRQLVARLRGACAFFLGGGTKRTHVPNTVREVLKTLI